MSNLACQTDPMRWNSERAVLGCVLLNERAIHNVVDVLGSQVDAFYFPLNRAVYQIFLKLWDCGTPIDAVTVVAELRKADEKEPGEGWAEFVTNLMGEVPTSTNARAYAKQVLARHREIEGVNAVKAVASSKAPEQELTTLADKIIQLNAPEVNRSILNAKQISEGIIEKLETIASAGVSGVSTGYTKVDQLLRGGFQHGDMIVVAARPSHGKTAIALNVAYRAAKAGATPFLVSLEMSREAICERFMGIHCEANLEKLYCQFTADGQISKVRSGLSSWERLPIHMCDESNLNISRIAHRCVSFAQRHEKAIIIIDYLQLISGDKSRGREVEVADISRQIKNIARQTNCPVVVCCQLNRESESQPDHFKKIAYLRESGSIEQDADVVIIVSRASDEEKKDLAKDIPSDDLRCKALILCVAKHRNGPIGTVALHFEKSTQRIREFGEFNSYQARWEDTQGPPF